MSAETRLSTFCPAVTDLSLGTLQTNQNALSNGDSPVVRNAKHQIKKTLTINNLSCRR
ncbi:hypothetical protein A6C57_26135 [Fibrella sp. ES10-3-2-2]